MYNLQTSPKHKGTRSPFENLTVRRSHVKPHQMYSEALPTRKKKSRNRLKEIKSRAPSLGRVGAYMGIRGGDDSQDAREPNPVVGG